MEFLKIYKPKHYDYFLPIAEKIINKKDDLNSWIRSLDTEVISIWLKTYKHLEKNNTTFFEESAIFVTVIIRLFMIELDVNDDIKLSNKEIIKLINRFNFALKTELVYRKDMIKKTPKYSIIQD